MQIRIKLNQIRLGEYIIKRNVQGNEMFSEISAFPILRIFKTQNIF